MSKNHQVADDIEDFLRQTGLGSDQYRSFSSAGVWEPRTEALKPPAPKPPALSGAADSNSADLRATVRDSAPSRLLEFTESALFNSAKSSGHTDANDVSLRLTSLGSGAGSTTIVANVGYCLATRGDRVVVADDSRDSVLSFHFGKRRPNGGLSSMCGFQGTQAGEVQLLAQGGQSDTDETERQGWLERPLDDSGPVDHVIMESRRPCLPSSVRARVSVLVVGAEPNSIYRLPEVMERYSKASPYLLLSRFDETRDLHREIRDWLSVRFGVRMAPIILREDPMASVALSAGRPLVEYDEESPLTQDLRALTAWLSALPQWGGAEQVGE